VIERIEGETISGTFDSPHARPFVTDLEGGPVLVPRASHHFRCVTRGGRPIPHPARGVPWQCFSPQDRLHEQSRRGPHGVGGLPDLMGARLGDIRSARWPRSRPVGCPHGGQGVLVVIHRFPSSRKPCPEARFPLALRPSDSTRRSGPHPFAHLAGLAIPPIIARMCLPRGSGYLTILYGVEPRFRATAFLCRLRVTKTLFRSADHASTSHTEVVQGARHALATLLQELNGANIGTTLQQVGGKGRAKGVGADGLRQPSAVDRHLNGLVDDAGVHMTAPDEARLRVYGEIPGGEDRRPTPCFGTMR
jgi:hypothetical protein